MYNLLSDKQLRQYFWDSKVDVPLLSWACLGIWPWSQHRHMIPACVVTAQSWILISLPAVASWASLAHARTFWVQLRAQSSLCLWLPARQTKYAHVSWQSSMSNRDALRLSLKHCSYVNPHLTRLSCFTLGIVMQLAWTPWPLYIAVTLILDQIECSNMSKLQVGNVTHAAIAWTTLHADATNLRSGTVVKLHSIWFSAMSSLAGSVRFAYVVLSYIIIINMLHGVLQLLYLWPLFQIWNWSFI